MWKISKIIERREFRGEWKSISSGNENILSVPKARNHLFGYIFIIQSGILCDRRRCFSTFTFWITFQSYPTNNGMITLPRNLRYNNFVTHFKIQIEKLNFCYYFLIRQTYNFTRISSYLSISFHSHYKDRWSEKIPKKINKFSTIKLWQTIMFHARDVF